MIEVAVPWREGYCGDHSLAFLDCSALVQDCASYASHEWANYTVWRRGEKWARGSAPTVDEAKSISEEHIVRSWNARATS